MQYFGHIARAIDLSTPMLYRRTDEKRKRLRPKRCSIDATKEWCRLHYIGKLLMADTVVVHSPPTV